MQVLHIRAFSLFAPLVGTSVMIIAVIVASVLVNNDIRTSRGITASYSRGELAGVAESIRAFVFATTADTVADTVKDALKDGVGIKCGSASECDSKMSAELLDRVHNSVKDNMMGAYGGAINSFVSKLPGVDVSNLNQVVDAMSLKLFKGFEGDEEGNSYVTVGREGMAPEDYSLVLKRGDITESVPMLPPQPLRVKLPWKIHLLSKELSDASGWAMSTGNLGSTCYAGGCSGAPQSWDSGWNYKGSNCVTSGGLVEGEIASRLLARVPLPGFEAPSVTVFLKNPGSDITSWTTSECCSCCGGSSAASPRYGDYIPVLRLEDGGGESCSPSYATEYHGRVSVSEIKADWSVTNKNKPELTIPMSYRNYQ